MKPELVPVVFHSQEQRDIIDNMKTNNYYWIFGLFILVLMSGCTEKIQNMQGSAQLPPEGEFPPSEQAPTVLENETSSIMAPEVNATSIEMPAENTQTEEKPELTFEQAVWKKRIDATMAPSYCPPVTKVEFPSSYYQGPLIDSHYHLPSLSDSSPGDEEGEEEIYRQYYGSNFYEEGGEEDDEEDAGGEEDEEPYLGKDIKISEIACTLQHEGTTRNFAFFPIRPEIAPHALDIVKKTEEQYPALFTKFTDMPLPPEDPDTKPEALSETLAAYPGLFKGWGEISLYVLKDGTGSYSPPDSPLFTAIYPIIK